MGLLAQSVGGGGGKAGKGGATSGGVSPVTNATKLFGTLSAGLNLGASVTTPINGILKIGKLATEVYSAADELYALAQQMAGDPGSIGGATSIDIGLSIGGSGGAAGQGGDLTVGNTGQISTFGAQSDGVFAQSSGGGGGKGGAASSTDTSVDDGRAQAAIGIGGGGAAGGNGASVGAVNASGALVQTQGVLGFGVVAQSVGGGGGAGGNGGSVGVVNASGALVQTQGVLGFGVVAQSVGGGGGSAGLAGTVAGSLVSLSVGIGGSGGSYGVGGGVKVTNAGAIDTGGKHSIGILAQSIGGGGGLARTMTTDETFDPADIINNPQGRLGDVHGLTLSFSGSTNTTGDGGTAEVDVAGSVATGGRTAHAILAQSIGGGGGAAIGGQVLGGKSSGGTGNGNGNTVTVATTAGAVISTAGDGAYGILAQSIGGGGGLGGSLADVSAVQPLAGGTAAVSAGTGSGGQVAIGLAGTRLTTTGARAPAIYAQSLGGGGGLIAQAGTLFSGGAGGSGGGNGVSVTLVNSVIDASGVQSPGIVIQTNGSGGAAVSIDAQSAVTGGAVASAGQTMMAGAIHILQGSGNTVTNAGTITGAGTVNPIALWSDAAVQIDNSGTITGAIATAGNGSVLTNRAGGVLDPGATLALGTGGRLANAGTLHVGGTRTIGATTVTGDLSSTGTIVFDADLVRGVGDKLAVTGHATITAEIAVASPTMRNARLALVSAAGGVTLAPQLAATASANQLFTYRFESDGTTLYATPQAQLAAQASGLVGRQQSVAGHLQSLFESGEAFDTGFTALSKLASRQDYAKTLDSLSGKALGAMAVQRYQSSRRFVSDVIGACDAPCSWARIQAGQTRQDEAADAIGYDAQFQVFEMGGQIPIAEGLDLGGALAYEHSLLRDSDGSARIDGDTMLGAIGLHYRSGALQLVGSVDGGFGWYASRRSITVGRDSQPADARPRLWNLGMALAANYRMPLGANSYLKPFAAVRGANVRANGFAEDSLSPFALQFAARGNFAASGTIGASLGTRIVIGEDARLDPFVTAAVEFAGGTGWETRARFVGESGASDPFAVKARAPGTIGRFGIGAELTSGPDFALSISYTPEFGSHYTTQQGVARLNYRF
ncbi:autotransporter outer membrane beta-barrel domain-containing protein [Polymorphobacter fuscus]|uniref:Autotransporter domain-containing protein n=1 Tax=Sandarakinorhabdus fusca TaxID=1439888 RepID=A0A7C9L041_9SPHN|nr:autotransporter outer membrane beta-barrel domain-containing protein [Polymorphobacter fuscus]KAB7643642.1 autotransporter domain-containing protein [Polymorphobacter fuscus]MQT18728.1 autotransporter domain-containing protein [Polymorphobacter fuscus]